MYYSTSRSVAGSLKASAKPQRRVRVARFVRSHLRNTGTRTSNYPSTYRSKSNKKASYVGEKWTKIFEFSNLKSDFFPIKRDITIFFVNSDIFL